LKHEGDDAKELAIMFQPYGYDIVWEDFDISRNHDWETSKLKEARHNIYAANGCHVEDTGADKASASVLGNVTNSISDKFDDNVIRKYQQMMSNFFCSTVNKVLSEATGEERFKDYRFQFSKTSNNTIIEEAEE